MSHLLTGHVMKTHNSTLANLCRGVGERVLYTDANLTPPVKPVSGIFVKRLASYRDQLVKLIGRQSPVTHDQFVSYYRGPRKLLYQRAVDGLALRSLRPADAKLKTFVKAEKINLSLKPDPVPRVIQPRSPRFNVELGKYLRPVEENIYECIDKLFNAPTIMSKYNSYEQAKVLRSHWDSFKDPVCIGLDASRFDQHVSAQALKFEHTIYDAVFKSKELRSLLQQQLYNRGVAVASDGLFHYTKYGSRMSGDMNTSLGNKILMCLMAKSYVDSLPVRVGFVNNGDDCLIFTERRNTRVLGKLKDYFLQFGFKIVCEDPVYEFEQVEFCQTKPIQSNGIWRMVRNVKNCLSKDLTCVNLGHRVDEYRAWLYDVGTCGLTAAADVPIMGSFYRMLQRTGVEGNVSVHDDYSWYYRLVNQRCLHHTPDDYGRYSFWLSTGIIPDIQVQLENNLNDVIWGGDKRQLIECSKYLFNG